MAISADEYKELFKEAEKQLSIFEQLDGLSEFCGKCYKVYEMTDTQKYKIITDTKFEFYMEAGKIWMI